MHNQVFKIKNKDITQQNKQRSARIKNLNKTPKAKQAKKEERGKEIEKIPQTPINQHIINP